MGLGHHDHGEHRGHDHAPGAKPSRRPPAFLSLFLTLGFALVEAAGGWWSHSLTLLGDAGHMLLDSAALGLSFFAFWVARRPPSFRHSYGLVRAEIVAAFTNSVVMVGIVIGLVIGAIERLQHPAPIHSGAVMLIAGLGILVNLGVLLLLGDSHSSLNARAAIVHVISDLLGSVAAVLSGAVIHFSGWLPIDPILSLAIAGLILYSSMNLLRETLNILMEGVPSGIDLRSVGLQIAMVPGIVSVHDLHIWTLSSGKHALSAHVVIDGLSRWNQQLECIRRELQEHFGISHVTLQPEIAAALRPAHYQSVIPIRPRD